MNCPIPGYDNRYCDYDRQKFVVQVNMNNNYCVFVPTVSLLSSFCDGFVFVFVFFKFIFWELRDVLLLKWQEDEERESPPLVMMMEMIKWFLIVIHCKRVSSTWLIIGLGWLTLKRRTREECCCWINFTKALDGWCRDSGTGREIFYWTSILNCVQIPCQKLYVSFMCISHLSLIANHHFSLYVSICCQLLSYFLLPPHL